MPNGSTTAAQLAARRDCMSLHGGPRSAASRSSAGACNSSWPGWPFCGTMLSKLNLKVFEASSAHDSSTAGCDHGSCIAKWHRYADAAEAHYGSRPHARTRGLAKLAAGRTHFACRAPTLAEQLCPFQKLRIRATLRRPELGNRRADRPASPIGCSPTPRAHTPGAVRAATDLILGDG